MKITVTTITPPLRPAPAANQAAAPLPRGSKDNVISLDAWRAKAQVRRTLNGVFFVSNGEALAAA